jgi:succinyl-CoA synthetase alpha subunit
MPHPSFLPGSIGVVAKSGTLSYEAVASTTRVGLGQSLVVGMGGDVVAGTSLVDAVRVFLEDPATEGIVVIGEVGGAAEMEVAEVIREYKGRKPVMALVAGECAIEGRVMGHAGAFRGFGDPSVQEKVKALENAGVTIVQHPGQFGAGMLKLLDRPMPEVPVKGMGPNGPQKRGLHMLARGRPSTSMLRQQRRPLYTKDPKIAREILEKVCPNHPAAHPITHCWQVRPHQINLRIAGHGRHLRHWCHY